MIICIQGLGYVGAAMCVAVANANKKYKVFGVDLPTQRGEKIIKDINNGIFPFKSSDLDLKKKIRKVTKNGTLKATSSTKVFEKASVVIVSINCDIKKTKRGPIINLKDFEKSIAQFAKRIKENTLVIIESTVPPGTCKKIVEPTIRNIFFKRKLNVNNIYLAHSYERVTPGKNYLSSIINNWRVYSGINDKSSEKCKKFLSSFINTKKYPLTKLANTNSSELSKLMENSFRAVNIAFIEEWRSLAEKIDIDLFEVIKAIKKRPTHNNMKDPGFGVGGYCLTKDPLMAKIGAKQLWDINENFDFSNKSVKTNNLMPTSTVNKIKIYFRNNLKRKKILLLGATYKEDIEDTRNSPSELFYKKMIKFGCEIEVHDPLVNYWSEVNTKVHKNLPDLKKFDAVVFAVKHNVYRKINFNKWKPKKKYFLFFDANNVLSNKQLNIIKKRFKIISIGRG